MKKYLTAYFNNLEFGKMQSYKNISVIPLFNNVSSEFEYMALSEALNGKKLIISEISEGGSVPQLKVSNQYDVPVLVIDGEELVGAKQNRVLNTSILLKEKSDTIIPVSCSEQGRWSYRSGEFHDSGIIMERKIRAKKVESINYSLMYDDSYNSDQGKVWNDIGFIT